MVAHDNNYISSLSPDEMINYVEKIKLCNNINPYSIDYDSCDTDWKYLPKIQHGDIVNYLVFSVHAITMKEMKAYKSLEAHNFFTSGWVKRTVYVKSHISNLKILLGEVNHSQSLSLRPLKVWILAKDAGEIVTAHCTCMAGFGASCSHVGALLFAICTMVELQQNRSVTDDLNSWLPTHIKNAPMCEIRELDFSSSTMKKKKLDSLTDVTVNKSNKKQRAFCPKPSEDEMSKFFTEVSKCGVNVSIMRVLPGFATPPPTDQDISVFPAVLSALYEEKYCSLPFADILTKAKETFGKMNLDRQKCSKIEVETREQYRSAIWFKYKAGRITASVMKGVCHTDCENPSVSLIKKICYPQDCIFKTQATSWGIENEEIGLKAYHNKMVDSHLDFELKKVGLCLNPEFNFLGASPDATSTCICCGLGVVEVKCPYTFKDSSIDEISSNKNSCLLVDSLGNVELKKNHMYYYQVQTQIMLCSADFADFVLWTRKTLYIQRISADLLFWEDILTKAENFYLKCILPELLCKCYVEKENKVLVK